MVESDNKGLAGFFANCILLILGIKKKTINEEELIEFITKQTKLKREDIVRVLDSEFLFMKIKGIVK